MFKKIFDPILIAKKIIIIENIKNQEHAETVSKAIQAAINEPIIIHSALVITAKASIGLARYPQDATDPESLLKAADESMYRAKKQKKYIWIRAVNCN